MNKIIVLLFIVFFNFQSSVNAERIFITLDNDEQGQGWLFGAKDLSGEILCWIALPSHIVGERSGFPDKVLSSFRFQTAQGKIGTSGIPVSINQASKAAGINNLDIDLAFARVESGFKINECLSQLGLSKIVYDTISKRRLILDALSLDEDLFDPFQLVLKRAGLKENGHIQILLPTSNDDQKNYLKGGISGAIATFQHNTADHPFSMITSVENGVANSIRFDAISDAFNTVGRLIKVRDAKEDHSKGFSVPYKIVKYFGKFLDKKSDPKLLLDAEVCWKMVPNGGQNAIQLELMLQKNIPVSGFLFKRLEQCGSDKIVIGIDVSYDGGLSWSRKAGCNLEQNAQEIFCPAKIKGNLPLRITATGRLISFSQLIIEP